ncbi:leucine-rich repeat protein kinase family protein [Striga asiatica]|uniref:Leucine-rich repeat protein kinase family protein n=1 Tax=Striga asiatica TaxID=4170 RepID=A0A5A7PZX8_STRAF|nr:leucine-rich repeat protein kinase family protein [Striga asiatica]
MAAMKKSAVTHHYRRRLRRPHSPAATSLIPITVNYTLRFCGTARFRPAPISQVLMLKGHHKTALEMLGLASDSGNATIAYDYSQNSGVRQSVIKSKSDKRFLNKSPSRICFFGRLLEDDAKGKSGDIVS